MFVQCLQINVNVSSTDLLLIHFKYSYKVSYILETFLKSIWHCLSEVIILSFLTKLVVYLETFLSGGL